MNGQNLERFVNAIASDLEEGGFREVTGTTLRRNLTTAVQAALPMLSEQADGTELQPTAPPALQADRAQFDAWMKSAGCYGWHGFNRIEDMWDAWQAALTFQPAGKYPVATLHPNGCWSSALGKDPFDGGPGTGRPGLKVYVAPPAPALELERYDAGLLSDVGGGDTAWWLDYLRTELGRAHDHYQHQVNPAKGAGHG
ncbi:hypothetical protein JJL50_15310 [Stenotrophomonas maltophilia]|uniref:Uncharacterized protein n=1 Tax=Stenotrophomonas maltophilia TaxID=40324 RepID=A0ABD7C015_STEMA|nr:hypothetical protein [Stenotrophomonas maltophilia]QQQ41311.1 hypothetical protein JJL50_15310 [Stenotrophomonas maltophilia]